MFTAFKKFVQSNFSPPWQVTDLSLNYQCLSSYKTIYSLVAVLVLHVSHYNHLIMSDIARNCIVCWGFSLDSLQNFHIWLDNIAGKPPRKSQKR